MAVFAQIARNWLMLHAVGVDASVPDATAVLIAIVVLSQLPVGPSVGAGAAVLILGADGPAATAAAGVLLTATGAAGALAYVAWAGIDRLWLTRLAGASARRTRRPRGQIMVGAPALVPALSPAGGAGPSGAAANRPAPIGTLRATDARSPAGPASGARRREAVTAQIVDDTPTARGGRTG